MMTKEPQKPTTEQIDLLLESFEAWAIGIGKEDSIEVMMEDISLFLHPFLMEKKALAFPSNSRSWSRHVLKILIDV